MPCLYSNTETSRSTYKSCPDESLYNPVKVGYSDWGRTWLSSLISGVKICKESSHVRPYSASPISLNSTPVPEQLGFFSHFLDVHGEKLQFQDFLFTESLRGSEKKDMMQYVAVFDLSCQSKSNFFCSSRGFYENSTNINFY